MNSATLLIFASAAFMLFAMHDKKKTDLWSSGMSDLSALLAKNSISTPQAPPSLPAQPVAMQPASAPAAAAPNPSQLLSSVFSTFQRDTPLSAALVPQKTYSRMELRIARGLVLDELPNGLVLDCGGWVVKSATNAGVYAGDGRGMNAIYANLVVTHERLRFGRLMTVDHGALKESVYPPEMWVPESYLYGTFLLEGYPGPSPGPGKGLKVVAAPSGNANWRGTSIPVYTATFTLND